MARGRTLVADIGRTSCRLAVDDGAPVEVVNGASLADPDGVAAVLAALAAAAGRLGLRDAQPGAPEAVAHVVVGVTGAGQAPAAAGDLADALTDRFRGAAATVTSDVVTAHLGALAGQPGVVTIAGTGAVALGVAVDGTSRLVDGHGPMLGDAGSGTWIGRRALEAALRAHDGRPGGSPALAAAASDRYGPLASLVATLQGSAHAWREVAAFVPDVAAAARAGDPVSRDLFARAVGHLADTTRAAAAAAVSGRPTDAAPVRATVIGGLAALPDLVCEPLAGALAHQDATPSGAAPGPPVALGAAAGDPLSGARRLALDGPGPHHHLVLQRPAPRGDVARPSTRHEER